MAIKTTVKLDVDKICNLIKVNKNTRSYIELKYKNEKFTEKEWKAKLKKDKLTF